MSDKLRVVIADDEPRVCIVVQSCIHWDELNLDLAGIAYNGKDLLDLIYSQKPDIVVTDIEMPEMNGLELIEQVRKDGLACKFIIISGYRQFEYAHKALKNNVEDYLLKPINEQELNSSLARLQLAIFDERIYSPKAVEELMNRNNQDTETIRRVFISRMLAQPTGSSLNIQEVEHEYGIHLGEGVYQAAIAKLDITGGLDSEDGLSTIHTKIIGIFHKLFESDCRELFALPKSELIYFGIYYDPEQERGMRDKFRSLYEYGKNAVELFAGFSLTVGVSSRHFRPEEFPKAFEESREAVRFRLTEGIDRTIFYETLTIPQEHFTPTIRKDIMEKLRQDFETLNVTDFQNIIDRAFFVLDPRKENPVEYIEFGYAIADIFFESRAKLDDKLDDEAYKYSMTRSRIGNAVTFQELKRAVSGSIGTWMEELIEKKKARKKKPVREAQLYVESHYTEDLTLETIAEKVELNPVYFSNIFKKETGENFVDYLHKVRMEKAKLRLRREKTPVAEIAMDLGYSDPKYFSKLFRKYVGIKPTDYRKIYG